MKLSTSTDSACLFLYPQTTENDVTRELTFMVGVHLEVPQTATSRTISSLAVTLVSHESLGFPRGGFETNDVLNISQDIAEAKGVQTQSGYSYHWQIPFKMSHTEAPYQRCSFGMVKTNLKAKITFLGVFNKTLTCSQNLFVTATPSEDIEQCLSMSRINQSFAEGLGPVITSVRSECFQVGGYLRFALSLPNSSPNLELLKLELTLIQGVKIKSRSDPSKSHTPEPSRMTFLTIEKDEFHKRQPESRSCPLQRQEMINRQHQNLSQPKVGYENDFFARIPNDNFARPTHVSGSKDAIVFNHFIEYSLVYSEEKGVKQIHKGRWPIVLPSCALRFHSLKLPSYTPYDPNPVPHVPRDVFKGTDQHQSHTHCACGESLETLMSFENEVDDSSGLGTTTSMISELRATGGNPVSLNGTTANHDSERLVGKIY